MCVRVRPLSSCCCWSRRMPAKLLEVLQAELLGEIVVELALARDLHGLDGHREGRRLALQILGRIIVGEGDLHVALVAGLRADQLVLEARDQLARAELDLHVGAGAAVERLAVDASGEVHHDQVAVAAA